jgi:hypothetical protein
VKGYMKVRSIIKLIVWMGVCDRVLKGMEFKGCREEWG